jgi:hypothetical protein
MRMASRRFTLFAPPLRRHNYETPGLRATDGLLLSIPSNLPFSFSSLDRCARVPASRFRIVYSMEERVRLERLSRSAQIGLAPVITVFDTISAPGDNLSARARPRQEGGQYHSCSGRHGSRRMNLYEKLADDIERSIRQGVYRHGERLPSVRQTSQQHRISVTTAIRAYLLLESRGLVTSKPQSGYFVNFHGDADERKLLELRPSRPIPISSPVDVSRLVLSTLRSIGVDDAVPLGSPYPDPPAVLRLGTSNQWFAARHKPSTVAFRLLW